jgi:hypothetical protein
MILKKISTIFIISLLILCSIFSLFACSNNEGNNTVAKEYITDFLNKNFDDMLNSYNYDAAMATVLTQKILEDAYTDTIEPLGSLTSLEYQSDEDGTISYLAIFESGSLILKVVFDDEDQISGFYYEPYDDLQMPDTIEEEEVSIGWSYELQGTLTTPKEGSCDTVVILVQGSGASDRNESMGALKPFRDIAWGLAQKGVAVYQYDKRTYTYAEKMAEKDDFTVYDEVIDDVVNAYNKMNSLGFKNIYIAGHSFGGYLMGRISQELYWADGYIIMAGNVTPIEDLMLKQIDYLANFDGTVTDSEQIQINTYDKQIANIKALTKENASGYLPSQLLGTQASYWLDLKNYDPIETIKKSRAEILILQGAKDYQVTLSEYAKWQNGLSDRDNVTYILYDNLNHLLMPSTVMSADDYANLNYVDSNVINDIYTFVSN